MSRSQAKEVVKKYASALKEAHFPFKAIYLFGSWTSGKPHRWSDIDIAVVSNRLRENEDKNRWLLWQIRMKVDIRIEPHGFTVKDFTSDENPMAYEIKRTGIRVV